jgi:hypothetical protein
MFLRGFCARRLLALCVLPLLVAGCGSGSKVVRVSGTVTCGGKPVPKLVVNFEPKHGRPSWGLTDKDGHYTLHYDAQREGAEIGTHTVWVEVKATRPGEEADVGKLKAQPEMRRILQKYGKFEKTPLTKEVKENDQVINLELD